MIRLLPLQTSIEPDMYIAFMSRGLIWACLV